MIRSVWAVLLMTACLAACAAVRPAIRAPLPPGVTGSTAAPVQGLYIHARESGVTPARPSGCQSSYWEHWIYRAGKRTAVFSQYEGCTQWTAAASIHSAEVPFVFMSSSLECGRPGVRCMGRRIRGVKVECRTSGDTLASTSECMSVELNATQGLILSRSQRDDNFDYLELDTDLIDKGAMIDPAVFALAHK